MQRGWRLAGWLLVAATVWVLVLAGRDVAYDLRLGDAQEAVERLIPHFPDALSRTAFTDTSGREGAPCRDFLGARPLVVLVIGQSNVANAALGEFTPGNRIGNYFAGQCFAAKNPLLGTSGERASAVLDFADAAIGQGLFDSALIVPLAVQGSSVFHWARHGELRPVLDGAVRRLQREGIAVNLVLYHQGEADCLVSLSGDRYALALDNVIHDLRRMGVKAPIVVSPVSRYKTLDCPDSDPAACSRICPEIRQAQAAIVDPSQGIFAGPDTDMAVPERFDGYHMTDAGRRRFAALLLETVAALPGVAGYAPVLAGQ
ncbi:SGNH/GDSL hydrolase family protein [Desulfovibrio aerotolerans]|uniref:SGNH/GDSL hydrolase family protein n=1 Tax=Solidesulfovibrio aerotolerans TaxID=295255 RepID=A0A7C9N2T5_9BACT|nr:sialate O-acetylesterase [Solidesulfovibrio aerotolerans]MYL85097.1 SGNH/GDSL hydrolase family protein [Solidesulfovibrio aerotolerans]